MKIEHKFMNDILKPWDELNELLSFPYCVEPELSTITKLATDLATAISHFSENSGIESRQSVGVACSSNQLMIDIADMSKHAKLRNSQRENKINVSSIFEYIEPSKFKFLRNKIIIEHNTYGQSDFMETSLNAILYWATKLGLTISRKLMVKDNMELEKATLIFNPQYCIHSEKVNCNFKKRNELGELIDFDTKPCRIEILDLDGNVKAFADFEVSR